MARPDSFRYRGSASILPKDENNPTQIILTFANGTAQVRRSMLNTRLRHVKATIQDRFERRMVFPITVRLLRSMAETATKGVRRPAMATGMLTAV